MKKISIVLLSVLVSGLLSQSSYAKDITLKGFTKPESIVVYNGDYYVSDIGEAGKKGDGTIKVIHNNKVSVLAGGLDDPKGIWIQNDELYVADNTIVRIIGLKGIDRGKIFVFATKFPVSPKLLNDITGDSAGNLYVSDTGEFDKLDGRIFKIDKNEKVTIFADYRSNTALFSPNGLIFDTVGNLLVIDTHTGKLTGFSSDGTNSITMAEGLEGGDGLAYDNAGNLYISAWGKNGGSIIYRYAKNGYVETITTYTTLSADIGIDKSRNLLLLPGMGDKAVRIVPLP